MTNNEKKILSTLKSIQGSGSFEKSGVKDFIPLGLHIKGIGEVSFPLNPIMTKAIIGQAKQAPFGKGSQTVTDTNVRSAWEIDADQLSFNNKEWPAFLEEIIDQVKEGLGIEEGQEIAASLYKLLIYQEGDFFLPHKDSEKEEGMFATLILSLPSNHTGGELIVRFEGKEEVIEFAPSASNYKIPFAAFYADCEHEVKPVTSGYRVNLVYNLVQKAGNKIYSPQFSEQVNDLVELIDSMKTSFDDEPKAILLDHQYTPTNFSLNQLKHHDWPRAQALLVAAEKAGYFVRLGLLTHYIMGDLEEDHSRYRRRGRGRYREYYNEPAEGEGTMGNDIYELYTKVKHWSQDNGPTLGEIDLDESNIITSIEIGDGKPIEQEQEGYTGNAGMTIEYWYHYGAVILWPKSKHGELLFHQPIPKRLEWLKYYTENWENQDLNSKAYTKKLLLGLTNAKEDDKRNQYYKDKDDYTPITTALIKLDDAAFLRSNFVELLMNQFGQIEVAQWVELLAHYPTAAFNVIFQKVGNQEDVEIIKHLLTILETLINTDSTKLTKFAHYHIQQLPTYLNNVPLNKIREKYSYKDDLKNNITIIVEKTIDLSFHNEIDNKWIGQLAKSLTRKLERDYANEVIAAILLKNKYTNNALAKELYNIIGQDLTKRTNVKPAPPENWKRNVPKSDYYKNELEIIRPFLESPSQQSFDYSKKQSYRDRMVSALSNVTIDLRMETIRKGSPHTLRLIKTQAAYELSLQHWKEDSDLLVRLLALDNN